MPNPYSLAAKLPRSFTIGTDTFIAKGEGYIVKLKRGRKATKRKAEQSPAKKAKKAKGKKKASKVRKSQKPVNDRHNVYLGKKKGTAKAKPDAKSKGAEKFKTPTASKAAPVARPVKKRALPVVHEDVPMVPQAMPAPALAPAVESTPTVRPDGPLTDENAPT